VPAVDGCISIRPGVSRVVHRAITEPGFRSGTGGRPRAILETRGMAACLELLRGSWRLRALRKAGSAEVYLGPAALLCCFERSLLRNQRRRVCSAVARLSIAVQNGSDMAALKTTSRRSTTSAGILAYRKGARGLEVLLVHPGGPFWRNKDAGAWSIPKGEIDAADAPEQVARREFAEELGPSASIGPLRPLGEIRQRGGKRVIAFAGEGHFDPAALISNTFDIEWPPRTGSTA
jgi:predicted NUDIX family NTP pyrophosphohydrolase